MYRKNRPAEFPIMPDGLIMSLIPLAAGGVISIWSWKAALIMLIPTVFILFFFRNPERTTNADSGDILSPADGKVLSVSGEDNEFTGPGSINISIFLSIFNVHINRSPVEGRVFYHNYKEGAMIPAFKSHASELNERNTIGIETNDGTRFIVRQITGFIARRIVWWVDIGSVLNKGEKFGFIKFGSCTQIILPAGSNITVSPGQKVKAGKTVIGVIK